MNTPLGKLFCQIFHGLVFHFKVIYPVRSIKCPHDVRTHSLPVDHCLSDLLGDELKQTVSIVVDIASVLDPDGVDIYFLNREPLFHVRNSTELLPAFAVPPAGLFSKTDDFSSTRPFSFSSRGEKRSNTYRSSSPSRPSR